jgi:hypothetical protein
VARLQAFFETYPSGDEYDTNADTHLMACSSICPRQLIETRRAQLLRGSARIAALLADSVMKKRGTLLARAKLSSEEAIRLHPL